MTYAKQSMETMRGELLAEIDEVIQGTKYWVGGRLDTIKNLVSEHNRIREAVESHLSAMGMMCEELTEDEIDEGVSVCENLGCTYCGLSRALLPKEGN